MQYVDENMFASFTVMTYFAIKPKVPMRFKHSGYLVQVLWHYLDKHGLGKGAGKGYRCLV